MHPWLNKGTLQQRGRLCFTIDQWQIKEGAFFFCFYTYKNILVIILVLIFNLKITCCLVSEYTPNFMIGESPSSRLHCGSFCLVYQPRNGLEKKKKIASNSFLHLHHAMTKIMKIYLVKNGPILTQIFGLQSRTKIVCLWFTVDHLTMKENEFPILICLYYFICNRTTSIIVLQQILKHISLNASDFTWIHCTVRVLRVYTLAFF